MTGLLISIGGLSSEAGTVRNCKTLIRGSIPLVASEKKRFTEEFR
jgi:hypothetical protein